MPCIRRKHSSEPWKTAQSHKMSDLIQGTATLEGTARFADRFPRAAPGHFRKSLGLTLASIGVGTYLGEADKRTDELYKQSIVRAVQMGSNVIDSAINYRYQRSERAICAALKDLQKDGFRREELIIATKAGFLSFDGEPPSDPRGYFEKTYLNSGLLSSGDIAAGSHSIAPAYLENQLNRSLENLGLETIDVFYIHNPEIQLEEIEIKEFSKRLHSAFEFLETAVEVGKILMYGTATWNAYRSAPDSRGFLNLSDIAQWARDVGGQDHHFGAIQLPYNLAMREAFALRNQKVGNTLVSTLEAAHELGITVMASASMHQARLTHNLPEFLGRHLPNLVTDAQRAIQFARSTPGITSALVGMSRPNHVEENLRLVEIPPVPADSIHTLVNAA